MGVHEATATWRGDLTSGTGEVSTKSGAVRTARVDWDERTEGTGAADRTSPEELLAAAHASCFSMALAARLAKNGTAARKIDVVARVTFGAVGAGKGVVSSELIVAADSDADAATLQELAEDAKDKCPISQALKGNVALSVSVAERIPAGR